MDFIYRVVPPISCNANGGNMLSVQRLDRRHGGIFRLDKTASAKVLKTAKANTVRCPNKEI